MIAGVALGCSSTYYDGEDGKGLVDDRGRSVAVEEQPKPGDLEFESESNAEINEEESIQDAIDESER